MPVEHTSAVTSITIDKPPSVAVGELMVAHLMVTDDRTVASVPTGWAEIQNAYHANNRTVSYWKRFEAGDPANFTWSFNASAECGGSILRITGAIASGNPIDDSSKNQGSSNTSNWPALTTTVDDCLIVRLLGRHQNYVTIPAEVLYNNDTSSASNPGQWACHHFDQETAGPVAAQNATGASWANWSTNSIAIKPP
ncbi:MAG: hypothetical protein GTO62_01460 [Planctomycetales bacterium]|nr:hypothetical protein [Planctomycetales bacterium]NIP67893.1 hypothetical protein [Planctomycetales bacterium]